ncbi:SACS [Symbiodinium microadriaticum]|nr:SACS [Symbiodinium microadriaticum]
MDTGLRLTASQSTRVVPGTGLKNQSLSEIKQFLKRFSSHEELADELLRNFASAPSACELVEVTGTDEKRWLRFGRFFRPDSERLQEVPFACLAAPLGGSCEGRVFVHLPLPEKTGLVLSDNRRSFWRLEGDLEGQHTAWAEWNEHVLQQVPREEVMKFTEEELYQLWPGAANKHNVEVFYEHFVLKIKERKVLFADGRLVSPTEAILLSTPTEALQGCRKMLERSCWDAGHNLVEMPEHVEDLLKEYDAIDCRDCLWAFEEMNFNSEMMSKLSDLLQRAKWIPTSCGKLVSIPDAFDPFATLPDLAAVKRIWDALRYCGLKRQLTWKDAAVEAQLAAESRDHSRAKLLFAYLEDSHQKMEKEEQQESLKVLETAAWVPASAPQQPEDRLLGRDPDMQLSALSELFPQADLGVVWAVKDEPSILIEQLKACARACPEMEIAREGPEQPLGSLSDVQVFSHGFSQGSFREIDDTLSSGFAQTIVRYPRPRRVPESLWHALRELFKAMVLHKNSIQEELQEVGFREACIPCLAADSESSASLYTLPCVALKAKSSAEVLAPAVGLLHPDEDMKQLAKVWNVAPKPANSVLANFSPHLGLEKAAAFCMELASWLSLSRREVFENLRVPTSSGRLLSPSEVYIDDAQWTSSRDLETVSSAISPKHARLLGCTSIRDKLAEECEDATDEDGFGQEADLVDQVKLLLDDYSSQSDVVAEFFQNADDHGAASLTFILCDQQHPDEKIVDGRSKGLQGPALYICSDKELSNEDIRHMQRVGRSSKRWDFRSTGRFGIGLNVMYKYSDCPQLLANGYLHFFDLSRCFVARDGQRRGKRFQVERLKDRFADTLAPFKGQFEKYAVVFRLPLRVERSELAEKCSYGDAERDLRSVAEGADSMLFFAQSIKSLSFLAKGCTIARHSVTFPEESDEELLENFLTTLPDSKEEATGEGEDRQLTVVKRLRSDTGTPATSRQRDWVVAYTLKLSSQRLRMLSRDIYEEVHGSALLPMGAAAAPLLTSEESSGRLCCGLPTPLAKVPVADSIRLLLLKCRDHVETSDHVPEFFKLLPLQEGVFQLIAEAAMRAVLADPIFPVLSQQGRSDRAAVRVWVRGPSILLQTKRLSESIQFRLASDGLEIVSLPEAVRELYAKVADEIQELNADSLCRFLQEAWATKHPDSQPVQVSQAGFAALSNHGDACALLSFVVKDAWENDLEQGYYKTTFTCAQLRDVPLMVTGDDEICTFDDGAPKWLGPQTRARSSSLKRIERLHALLYHIIRFSAGRDLLPNNPGLFVHSDIMEVFRTANLTQPGVSRRVSMKPVGVQPFTLNDLLKHREQIESQVLQLGPSYRDELWSFLRRVRRFSSDWFQRLGDWRILPVESPNDSLELVPLSSARQSVRAGEYEHLQEVLEKCSIHTLQTGFRDDLVSDYLVSEDSDLIRLLVAMHAEHGIIEHLSKQQRHSLLVHFSRLSLMTGGATHDAVDIKKALQSAAELPLFLKAQGADDGSFAGLAGERAKYCCLHPDDPHAAQLEKLMPSTVTLLSWPTREAKPIYEFYEIRVCNGEEFMIEFVLPCIPEACKSPETAKPYLELLYAYVVEEESHRVTKAARDLAFVPDDESNLRRSTELLDPMLTVAGLFGHVLAASLPAKWLRNERSVSLLKKLGLMSAPSLKALVCCARHLDSLKLKPMTPEIRKLSFHLVEAVAHWLFSSQRWLNLPDVLLVSQFHIVVTRDLRSSLQQEAERCLRVSDLDFFAASEGGEGDGILKLRPFGGTAFGASRQVLWSVCPISAHKDPELGVPEADHGQSKSQLDLALEQPTVSEALQDKLGAHVSTSKVEPARVLVHMQNLCRHPHPKSDKLQFPKSSAFNEHLVECWELLKDPGSAATSSDSFADLRCVKLQEGDAADRPKNDMVTLASPRRCFLFSSGSYRASDFHGYLFQAERTKEDLWSSLGVRADPGIQDFAMVTREVAANMEGRAAMEQELQVLETCLSGVHDCVSNPENCKELPLSEDFFWLDRDKRLVEASKLHWMDVPSWKSRVQESGLHFCQAKKTGDQDPLFEALARAFGLRKLSTTVAERPAKALPASSEAPEEKPAGIKDAIRALVTSPSFAAALQAIAESIQEEPPEEVKTLLQERCSQLTFAAVPKHFETALYLDDAELTGSRQKVCVCWNTASDTIFVSDDAFIEKEKTVKELAAIFQRFMLELASRLKDSKARSPLESIMECAFDSGPDGIAAVLAEHGIEATLTDSKVISCGDELPDKVSQRLVQSLSQTFKVDEYVAIRGEDDRYVLGQIMEWEESVAPDEVYRPSLMRQYLVRLDKPRRVYYVDIYKIQGGTTGAGHEPTSCKEIQVGTGVSNGEDEFVPAGADSEQELERVKQQLREMSEMSEQDYKKSVRRLYREWHPDTVGNTDFNNMMFRMIKRHVKWFQNGRHGNQDWLDGYNVGQEPAEATASAFKQRKSEASKPGEDDDEAERRDTKSAHRPRSQPSQQVSWFEEFDREVRRNLHTEATSRKVAAPPTFVPSRPPVWQPPRIDEDEALTWLRQAEYDFKALEELLWSTERVHAHVVWHAHQVVEKALKSAMLRTCGLAEEEFTGHGCHDLAMLYGRLAKASPESTAQRRAQEDLPSDREDMRWLTEAYLSTRYPNMHKAGQVPALAYDKHDATRAARTAEQFIEWAQLLEDLPIPGSGQGMRKRPSSVTELSAEPAPAPPRGPRAQASKPEHETRSPARLPAQRQKASKPLPDSAPVPLPPESLPPLATTQPRGLPAEGDVQQLPE